MKIICLANSWKKGDLCFAGILDKERETWVRPLGMGTDGAVSERAQALDRGGIPEVLHTPPSRPDCATLKAERSL